MLKPRNLEKRKGVWYIRVQFRGKRIFRSTGHVDRAPAWERAKQIYSDLVSGGDLMAGRIRGGYATIGQVVAEFRAGAALYNLRPRTVEDYVRSLGLVLEASGVTDLDRASTQVLTRQAVTRYAEARLAAAGAGDVAQVRARRTIASTLRQARALFGGKWALSRYAEAGLRLPAVDGFVRGRVIKAAPVQYWRPPEALVQRTLAAGAALPHDGPLWPAWLLCYWLALRAGEAAAAQWAWLSEDGGRYWMTVCDRPEQAGWAGPKGASGRVPVPSRVWEWLQAVRARRTDDPYILPGGSRTVREALVKRDLAAWMRGIGWDAARYTKAAHELRKLRGSEYYTERGIEAACAWLRHRDIGTTKRYYAAFTHHPPAMEVPI